MSRARVPPANATPGERYAEGPIRRSVLRPRSTSRASAPMRSATAAISLMNAIGFSADANDDAIGLREDLERLSETQVLGRTRERESRLGPPYAGLRLE